MKRGLHIIGLSFLFLLLPVMVHAEIVVFDDITAVRKPVMLRAIIKGRFFPAGGKLVHFFVEDKRLGKTLSGWDGYAFFEYIPKRSGFKTVMVRSGDESAEGLLLVMRKNERVILLEIEGSLTEPFPSRAPKHGSREGIKKIMAKYKIIYLTTMLGLNRSRNWLKDNNLKLSVILRWTGTELLDELQSLGAKCIAIIGSPSLMAEASEHVKKRYSFDDTEDATVVEDWTELAKKLRVE